MTAVTIARRRDRADPNRLAPSDPPVHGWYRFVLSYPPHVVREYLERFGIAELAGRQAKTLSGGEAQRLKIAGDTAARLIADVPSRMISTWRAQELNFATLFLVDVLSCALGFDAPTLVDWHRTWLKEILLPRGVPPKLIVMHLKTLARVLTRSLESGDAQQFKLLLARMEEN
jgi:hypothetical protein